jgi:hypothetical protein
MERSAEIEALVTSWFTAATKGDASLVDQYVPNDPDARLIGSDPAEWLRGGDAIGAFLRSEIAGAGGDVTFTPSETEGYAEGSVGWAATKLTLRLPTAGRSTPGGLRSCAVVPAAGSSCRPMRRSRFPTTRSAGHTNEGICDRTSGRRKPL